MEVCLYLKKQQGICLMSQMFACCSIAWSAVNEQEKKYQSQRHLPFSFWLESDLVLSLHNRNISQMLSLIPTKYYQGVTLALALTCDHTLPPLYWEAVKEGMIHLLVGSYVKKPDSGVFSDWSRNNAYETLHSYWLSYFNLISGQNVGLARRKQNGGDRVRF